MLAPMNKTDRAIMGQFGLASLRFFFHWRTCVNSGPSVKIIVSEGEPVPLGYCKIKKYDVDFQYQCADCKDHREQRAHPRHEKTPVKKKRIALGRQRSIQKQAESFKARVYSKAINEYGQEDPKGSARSDNGAIDPGKKTKKTNKARK